MSVIAVSGTCPSLSIASLAPPVKTMSEYDPFNIPEPTAEERQQKHFLDSNGLWLNNSYSFLNQRCLCGCTASRHLDGYTICLNSRCLCEGFVQEGYRVTIPRPEMKLPKKGKEEVQVHEELNSYIQTLSET